MKKNKLLIIIVIQMLGLAGIAIAFKDPFAMGMLAGYTAIILTCVIAVWRRWTDE